MSLSSVSMYFLNFYPFFFILSEKFVEEETFITSGISFIRNRIDYVRLGKSLSFLFHSTAVCSPVHFGCSGTSPPSTGSHEVILFVILGRRAQYVQGIICLFFFNFRSSTRLQSLHPSFLCFWRCSCLSRLQK